MPDPKHPVNHGMVEEKDRVARTVEEITTRVTTCDEMRTTMYAAISSRVITLHAELKIRNIFMKRQEIRKILLRCPMVTSLVRDIPPQAPRIPLQRVVRRLSYNSLSSQERLDRSKVNCHVVERSLVHTATTVPERDTVPQASRSTPVRGIHPVSTHAQSLPSKISEWSGSSAVAAESQVGEGALVAALADEGLFVVPRKGAVPRQEVCRIVDRLRLVDVDDDEVVVPRLGPWGEAWVVEGWLEAQCGVDVGHALLSRQACPFLSPGCRLEGTTSGWC